MTNEVRCEFCGDTNGEMFLHPRCHPTAPLLAVKEGDWLTLRCYIPHCNREVVRLRLATPMVIHEVDKEHP